MDSLSVHSDYGSIPLAENDLDIDPFAQFARWLADAERADIIEPNAMVLSTVDADGAPSSRTVLLRGVRDGGFEFFTNYDSRKGQALAVHPRASLLFGWYALQRQVIVEGSVEHVSAAESDSYFAGRPRGSRLAAIASQQSRPVDDRSQLEARMTALEAQYPDGVTVPRPPHWGGFRLTPSRIEFWKGRQSRLHDRLVYGQAVVPGAWVVTRLQP